MAYEIERKFLVASDGWRQHIEKTLEIKQAYFCNTEKASLRIRISNQSGYISSKSMTMDIKRHEFEYEIPLNDAKFMLEYMCTGSPISKKRHLIRINQHTWEIDEFLADNKGLVVAEIELGHEDEAFNKPDWVGKEVSNDPKYINMSLVTAPYRTWTT